MALHSSRQLAADVSEIWTLSTPVYVSGEITENNHSRRLLTST